MSDSEPRTSPGAVAQPPVAPSTPRGRQTRERIIAAARSVFEVRGFLEARVSDITEAAGVSHGSFYNYFNTKEEIFREVALALQRELVEASRPEEAASRPPAGPFERVERATRRYLLAYRENAPMMAIIEQVATFNEEMRAIRRDIRQAFVVRAERGITRLQGEGLARADVDPRYAANALGSMIDRFAYVWLVLGEDFEFEPAVETLTKLWAGAIGLVGEPPTS